MNCIKFHPLLAFKKKHFHLYILGITVSMFLNSCGGGPVPEYLKEAKVEVTTWTPQKEEVFKKDGLNLVKAIVPLKDSNEFLIVSGRQVCKLKNNELNSDFQSIKPSLSKFDIISDNMGEPSYILGSGLWGNPSIALFDINGELKWRKDFGYNSMGKAVILDDGDDRFAILKIMENNLIFFNFETGEVAKMEPPYRLIESADFSGDGRHEILVGLTESDFAILDGKLNELYTLSLTDDYWDEPITTSAILPFIVFSAGDVLDIYDSKLNLVKKFEAQGALSPMHVTAATFLGKGPDAPFAALYHKSGGWHMSILYVFSASGELVYKEILKGDFCSIAQFTNGEKTGFLLGGRDKVLQYSFDL